ncbi:hypothetical protein KJ068_24085 [bacterium]|nr:hypothetical protein [bacterium]NUM72971.1 hypothetical protein [candidate division KSB1 bacterium]
MSTDHFAALVEDPITIATIVIAIATVIYTIATICLWRTTESSVRLTKHLFEASNGPFIGVKSLRFENPSPRDNTRHPLVLEIKNFGNLAGIDVTIGPKFEFEINNANEGLSIPFKIEPVVLPPGHDNKYSFDVNNSDYVKIAQKRPLFIVTIRISYNSIYKRKNSTKWIYKYKYVGDQKFNLVKAIEETDS